MPALEGLVVVAEAATPGTFVLGVVLMGGTSMIGTLLGPEGSDGAFCVSGADRPAHDVCRGWGGVVAGRVGGAGSGASVVLAVSRAYRPCTLLAVVAGGCGGWCPVGGGVGVVV